MPMSWSKVDSIIGMVTRATAKLVMRAARLVTRAVRRSSENE